MSDTATHPRHAGYLMPSLEHAIVADAMHPGILSCQPDATLTEVAQLMATNHVHCLAVIGISHEEPQCAVWSIVSDLDLIQARVRGGKDSTASSMALQPVITIDTTTPLHEAAELMATHKVNHLVVTDPQRERPVGILSTLDLAGVLAWGEACGR